ncbi:MAG: electron transport complex, RnfABCDGE type, subunit [Oscillospiraceae bacterium]|jgi:electron transport complex protein RnfE|nr:electron transport complex, RnfABCDGE type, subunit [Oscillospiraceae bacterium]
MGYLKTLTNGILKENPVLVLMLGMCPSLAVTTVAKSGIGMGIATTFVLLGSNIVISLIKNLIPKAVRLPSFIVIIAGFVTMVGFLVEAYAPQLNKDLGIFLPLIVVNCIILARAEIFASQNGTVKSILDALGMGIGFTLALFLMGSVRELIGSGTWLGMTVTKELVEPMKFFVTPAGGFFTLGIIIAVVNFLTHKKPSEKNGCHGCPSADACAKVSE